MAYHDNKSYLPAVQTANLPDFRKEDDMNDYAKITALYERLSIGDEQRGGEDSNSIKSQKAQLNHSFQVVF